jgi:phosphoenolpyruvate carboxykinase (GTP)
LPTPEALDTDGLDIDDDDLAELLRVDAQGWRDSIPEMRDHYARFGEAIPASLTLALDTLEQRLT